MSYSLRNKSEYLGKQGDTDWWRWTAYIDVDNNDTLDDVDYVEYLMHSSFRNPVKRVRHIEGGFPISAKGWGTFTLKARVVFKNKGHEALLLEHSLEFDPTDQNIEVVTKG